MGYQELADAIFPTLGHSLADYEKIYPPRPGLMDGAAVCRLAPSPTGFIHMGNLYMAMADDCLSRQTGGIFCLRIEDTDDKREVEGAVESLKSSLGYFGIRFDEGEVCEPQGNYGPYRQSERVGIYQAAAKELLQKGLAYPCFCTEEDLANMREEQEQAGESNLGYTGKWAKCRHIPPEEAQRRVEAGEAFTIRLRSKGDGERRFSIEDGIRGRVEMPENTNDIVILKTNGVPTYHFAHVVDDHFMRITHVLRGEEWMSSLPIHVELFGLMGWPEPIYCHTSLLMKLDEGKKRKLSKRKDPELGLEYYRSLGYHPAAVKEYLMALLNSDYEEWRASNPDEAPEAFEFRLDRMSASGALVDLDKLEDVSKNTLARLQPREIAEFLSSWASEYAPELKADYSDIDYLEKICAVGREEKNPRKDLAYGRQAASHIAFYFDGSFRIADRLPDNISGPEAKALLAAYLKSYSHADDKTAWFEKVRQIASDNGYAARPKDFKKEPGKYKGHVGDVSAVIRLALTGRQNAPDIWEVQQVLGEERTRQRLCAFEA